MERRERAAAPSRATCAPATARISAVISSRTRSRAVRGAEAGVGAVGAVDGESGRAVGPGAGAGMGEV